MQEPARELKPQRRCGIFHVEEQSCGAMPRSHTNSPKPTNTTEAMAISVSMTRLHDRSTLPHSRVPLQSPQGRGVKLGRTKVAKAPPVRAITLSARKS